MYDGYVSLNYPISSHCLFVLKPSSANSYSAHTHKYIERDGERERDVRMYMWYAVAEVVTTRHDFLLQTCVALTDHKPTWRYKRDS